MTDRVKKVRVEENKWVDYICDRATSNAVRILFQHMPENQRKGGASFFVVRQAFCESCNLYYFTNELKLEI